MHAVSQLIGMIRPGAGLSQMPGCLVASATFPNVLFCPVSMSSVSKHIVPAGHCNMFRENYIML